MSKKIGIIRKKLPQTMFEDRVRLLKKLGRLEKTKNFEKGDRRIYKRLEEIERLTLASVVRKERRRTAIPPLTFPPHLPIFPKMRKIIETIRKNRVVIISGDTGSGKSTQLPKMCLEAGLGISGKIGCTQPRRIAAITIARRIADELKEEIGHSVGYKIRFSDRSSPDSYIKILTDGMLLAEAQRDPLLNEYDALIIDEAHERSLNVDFLLGILRTLVKMRNNLRVIITSATIDTEKFSRAFDRAPVIHIKGRSYPVEIEYFPPEAGSEEKGDEGYIDMAVKALEKLEKRNLKGDVLIFMPTEADIRETCDLLDARGFPRTKILPLFARLTGSQQKRIFAPFSGRKIVVATNVAETSLTIPGIKYVIDTGLARIPAYNPRTRTTSLPISPISKSSAEQRKGRCGRMEHGICIRLYSEEDYLSRHEFTPPEILRSNLAEVILRMLSLKLGDIDKFPFLDRPSPRSVKDGIDLLVELGAVSRKRKGLSLSEKGVIMARMPLDPKISRMMLEAAKEGCIGDMAVIASVLSIQDPRERPLEKVQEADDIHSSFRDPDSDFITLVNFWNRYHRAMAKSGSQNSLRKYCREHYLSYVRMREWQDIHRQILAILKEQKINIDVLESNSLRPSLYERIHRCVLSGFLSNIAMKKGKNTYTAARGREVMVFPGSSLFNKGFEWTVCAEIVKTSRLFARTAARIDSAWLEALGGELCKRSYSEPHWEKNRGEVVAFEQVTLFGLPIITKRPVSYGPLSPEESREIFIRHALVRGEIKENFGFVKHNLSLIKRVEEMEDKIRRKGFVLSEPEQEKLYMTRLPGITDVRSLKKLIKAMGGDGFLTFREEDVVIERPDESLLSIYPDQLDLGKRLFPISYRFAPGTEEDGVTVHIPSTLAQQFPIERLEWLVPGFLKEKIAALIKGLPKRYRKNLVPVADSVEIIFNEMERTEDTLINALSRFIHERFGVDIPASEWITSGIPEHLRMRFSLVDHEGKEIKTSRDVSLLRNHTNRVISEKDEPGIWKEIRKKWERSGLIRWDFPSLPEQESIGPHFVVYPALVPEEDSVGVRLFLNRSEAINTHLKGVEALFNLHFSKELKFLKRTLDLPKMLFQGAVSFGGIKALENAIFRALTGHLFRVNIRNEEAFYVYAERTKPALLQELNKLVEKSEKIVTAFTQTRTKVQSIEKANRDNSSVLALCASIRRDLARMIPPDFLNMYSEERLIHLPRYIKAMEIRAERGAYDVEKDRKKETEYEVFSKLFRKIKEASSEHMSPEKSEAIETYSWMLEEYKVSLFAPELKTPFPVSPKRMKEKVSEIERMI